MTKWGPVIIGFILAILVKNYVGRYEFFGLLIIGFLVGYMAKDGALGGLWNAAVAGALGTIVSCILISFAALFGGTILGGLVGGLAGIGIAGISSIFVIIGYLIYYALVMGISGAVGGAIAKKDYY